MEFLYILVHIMYKNHGKNRIGFELCINGFGALKFSLYNFENTEKVTVWENCNYYVLNYKKMYIKIHGRKCIWSLNLLY